MIGRKARCAVQRGTSSLRQVRVTADRRGSRVYSTVEKEGEIYI